MSRAVPAFAEIPGDAHQRESPEQSLGGENCPCGYRCPCCLLLQAGATVHSYQVIGSSSFVVLVLWLGRSVRAAVGVLGIGIVYDLGCAYLRLAPY